jgi:hypothetical protein
MTEEDEFSGADYVEYETGKFAVCVYIKGSG